MADIVCHCFNYTDTDIERDFLRHGRSLILAEIQTGKKMGQCRCSTVNPKGR